MTGYAQEAAGILHRLGAAVPAGTHDVRSPIDGSALAQIEMGGRAESERAVGNAATAFLEWRRIPAPR
ncbi:MAG TPA: hypothetical protein VK760_03745, partial [Candidatus Acidoferrales bacterium]|nr:hypothetical protein [Candidatus Acidoferrales bacterium]